MATKKEDELPGTEEQKQLMEPLLHFAADQRFAYVRQACASLAAMPPQSLLLEGGTAHERMSAALYWAALLNCPEGKNGKPCLACAVCTRLGARLHRDLFFFDGEAGSIKIDDVRAMRAILGEPPREATRRVVILHEAQALGEAAANALLKSLEDPRPGTHFTLSAPQRERLLPTLVSRSWVLTLPWPRSSRLFKEKTEGLAETLDWAHTLLMFARSGQGWMERTAKRGALDAALAMRLVLFCQGALAQALAGAILEDGSFENPLAEALSGLQEPGKRIFNEVLAECQESLNNTVNPALVLDWLATRLFFLMQQALRS